MTQYFCSGPMAQIEHHTCIETQMHCAGSGVLYVCFVTLLQPTPDWLQYFPHVQHVGQWQSEQLHYSHQGDSYCSQEASPTVHKMKVIKTICQNKHQLVCGVGWQCRVICDVLWMHDINHILDYPCSLTFHLSSPFQYPWYSELYCNFKTVI